jgi:hypothetical protein
MPDERSGLLIIRAWIEKGSSEPLRADIRLTTDVSTGWERTLTVARVNEVCATVCGVDWAGIATVTPEQIAGAR